MKISLASLFALSLLLTAPLSAAEHRVEVLNEAPPTDGVSKAVAATLSPTGYRVIRGTSRTVCEIWLCKEWQVKADFKANDEVLYPFTVGQLIGVARYPRKGGDFRDQDIGKGVYTIRYAQQPVDGNHEGTSPTRDFFLLLNAEKDPSTALLDYKKLAKRSSEAAESSHPALLSMQRLPSKEGKVPSIRHNEEKDWWIVRMAGKGNAKGKASDLVFELLVVGHADE